MKMFFDSSPSNERVHVRSLRVQPRVWQVGVGSRYLQGSLAVKVRCPPNEWLCASSSAFLRPFGPSGRGMRLAVLLNATSQVQTQPGLLFGVENNCARLSAAKAAAASADDARNTRRVRTARGVRQTCARRAATREQWPRGRNRRQQPQARRQALRGSNIAMHFTRAEGRQILLQY